MFSISFYCYKRTNWVLSVTFQMWGPTSNDSSRVLYCIILCKILSWCEPCEPLATAQARNAVTSEGSAGTNHSPAWPGSANGGSGQQPGDRDCVIRTHSQAGAGQGWLLHSGTCFLTLGFCPDTRHRTAIYIDGGEIGISCDAISRDTCPDNATWLTRLTRVAMQLASNLGSEVTAEVQPTGLCTIVKGSREKNRRELLCSFWRASSAEVRATLQIESEKGFSMRERERHGASVNSMLWFVTELLLLFLTRTD